MIVAQKEGILNKMINDVEITITVYETDVFLAYSRLILATLSAEPMSLRQLHTKLGERANKRLTLDALTWNSDHIANDSKIPCRYWLEERRRTPTLDHSGSALANVPDKYHRARGRGILNSGIR